jgi:hypothetical protein
MWGCVADVNQLTPLGLRRTELRECKKCKVTGTNDVRIPVKDCGSEMYRRANVRSALTKPVRRTYIAKQNTLHLALVRTSHPLARLGMVLYIGILVKPLNSAWTFALRASIAQAQMYSPAPHPAPQQARPPSPTPTYTPHR